MNRICDSLTQLDRFEEDVRPKSPVQKLLLCIAISALALALAFYNVGKLWEQLRTLDVRILACIAAAVVAWWLLRIGRFRTMLVTDGGKIT